jgi:hypothetical protein
MSSLPPIARSVAATLRAGAVAPAPSDDVRARHVAALADAMRAAHKRRAAGRLAVGFAVMGASAALAAGVVLYVARAHSPAAGQARPVDADAAFVQRGNARLPIETAGDLAQNDELLAGTTNSSVALRTGTRLDLRARSKLLVQELGSQQSFLLTQGSVEAKVAKVSPTDRFLIRTTDTEVEVRGTVFEVRMEPEASCGSRTRVHVTEGVVVVRPRQGAEVQLRAGQSFPSCEANETPIGSAAPTPATSSTPPKASSAAPVPKASAAPSSTTATASELAEQNNLFAAALAARRQGRNAEALQILDTLRGRHPNGTLSESVYAERLKILARTDKAQARLAAREYIKKHPGGPSTHEAALLLEQDVP